MTTDRDAPLTCLLPVIYSLATYQLDTGAFYECASSSSKYHLHGKPTLHTLASAKLGTMFETFESFTVKTETDPTIKIFGRISENIDSQLPPILMLHGFPQSHHIWHRVTEQLVQRYSIVLIDIRGYGASSKPSELHHYAKSAMAKDCISVMDSLGFTDHFFVCGHDRGARVAHKLCVDFPSRVQSAMLLDICPTLAMYTATDQKFASAYFHWFFLTQPEPLPETMINGCPRHFGEFCLGVADDGKNGGIYDQTCLDYYLSMMEHPETVHAMCQDYRASATLDLDEARDDLNKGRLICCPLRVLWGDQGVIEKCFDALQEWRAVTAKSVVVDGHSVKSGHFIPEAAPDDVVSNILDFFK